MPRGRAEGATPAPVIHDTGAAVYLFFPKCLRRCSSNTNSSSWGSIALRDETIPTGEPSPAATVEPTATEATDFDVTPWIGLATIPLVIGAIAILIRMLGKRDSEDHLT